MEEREFLKWADAELERLELALAKLQAQTDLDFDYEQKPGGIIELSFADGSKIIVNRHAAAREIWVAARSGGFHFKPPQVAGGAWCGTRDGQTLASVLSHCLSEQVGGAIQLLW